MGIDHRMNSGHGHGHGHNHGHGHGHGHSQPPLTQTLGTSSIQSGLASMQAAYVSGDQNQSQGQGQGHGHGQSRGVMSLTMDRSSSSLSGAITIPNS